MKIAINADMFMNSNYTGIPRYAYEIITYWSKAHNENEYYLLSNRKLCIDKSLFPENWHFIDQPVYKTYKWLFKLAVFFLTNKIDAYWTANSILPFFIPGIKYYSTIHDLAFLKYDVAEEKNSIRLKRFLKPSVALSKKIFVVSKSTAKDVIKLLHIPKKKIIIGYPGKVGLRNKYFNLKDESFDNKELQVIKKYFLFISTIEPRKNIPTIVRAYEEYCDRFGTDYSLILAGGLGWKYDAILEAIENSRYRKNIILPGFISEKDKILLLNNADIFLFPSLYEGFGLPILEAFEFGVPVITTNVSSMPEVAGDAAFYINDPYDSHALANQMNLVVNLNEDELDIYKMRMAKRLSRFRWEKVAEKIINSIETD
ncbi:MAG: glycosyltransferase family 4 protein [Lachnospiraceae bacterium]|nr:glycosyltransferase family 4 protein [Lachnospiraceae bacterium]